MTAVRFPVGHVAVRNTLRRVLTGRSEPYARGVTVSTTVPPGAPPSIPYVLVGLDDSGRDARLNGYALVRVTVYHRDEPDAFDLAALCEALLLDATDAEVRAVQPTNGPTPTNDPDSGAPLAFFRVTARLRPTNL